MSTTQSPSIGSAQQSSWWRRSVHQIRQRPFASALILVFILAAAAIPGYYFGYLPWLARQHFAKAQEALNVDDFATAQAELRQSLETTPGKGDAHFLLARTLRRTGKFGDATGFLKKAEQAGYPKDEIGLEYLLADVNQHGPFAPALRAVLPMLESRSTDEPVILEAVVLGYFQHRALPEALHWLNHWVKHYPNDWSGWYLRGDYFFSTGSVAMAVGDYEKAMSLCPRHPKIRQQLGLTHLKIGRELDQTARLLTEQLERRPDDPQCIVGLARCQRAQGQNDAARTTLDRLLRRLPNDPAALLTLAHIEADDDQPAKARTALERLQKLPLQDVDEIFTFVNLSAGVYRRLGIADQAEKYEHRLAEIKAELAVLVAAVEALSKGAHDVALQRKVGLAYIRIGAEQTGMGWLMGALRQDPNDKETRALVAEYTARQQHPGGK